MGKCETTMYRFITSKFLIGLKITIRKTISVFLIPNIIEAFCETIPTTSYFEEWIGPKVSPAIYTFVFMKVTN